MPVVKICMPMSFKEQILDVLDHVNKDKGEDQRIGQDEWARQQVRLWILTSRIADIYQAYRSTGKMGDDSPKLNLTPNPGLERLDSGEKEGYVIAIMFGDNQLRQLRTYIQFTNESNKYLAAKDKRPTPKPITGPPELIKNIILGTAPQILKEIDMDQWDTEEQALKAKAKSSKEEVTARTQKPNP